MSPSDALYRSVCASPHDDLPRLVYADWLEENGRPHRAEFIRVQCRLADASPADTDYVDLLEREAELKAILWRELEADRPALPAGIGWEPEHRGFAERLRFGLSPSSDLVERLAGCSAGVPIGGLRFEQLGIDGLRPFAAVVGETITSLELPNQRGSSEPINASVVFPALQRLVLHDNHITFGISAHPALRELAVPECGGALPPGLRVLDIRLNLGWITAPLPELHTLRVGRFTRNDAEVFIAHPKVASLNVWTQNGDWVGLVSKRNRPLAELRMNFNPSPKASDSLFRRDWFERLRVFTASGDEERMRAACTSPRLTELRQLRIPHGGNPLTPDDFLHSVYWPSLTTFEIPHFGWGRAECYELLSRIEAPNLRHLNLRGVPLGDAGAVALANNASLANLTRLNVAGCRIGPRGVQALLESPHLQRLIELNLYANTGGDSLAALADPGVMPNLGLADVAANGVSDEVRRRLEQRPAVRAR
jgi:uncharacterized protein (TIGR02996 family)